MIKFDPPIKSPIPTQLVRELIKKSRLPGFMQTVRKKCRVSQKELADLLEINPQTLSSIEIGARLPSLGLLLRWCSVFDVSLAELAEYLPAPFGKKTKKNIFGETANEPTNSL